MTSCRFFILDPEEKVVRVADSLDESLRFVKDEIESGTNGYRMSIIKGEVIPFKFSVVVRSNVPRQVSGPEIGQYSGEEPGWATHDDT